MHSSCCHVLTRKTSQRALLPQSLKASTHASPTPYPHPTLPAMASEATPRINAHYLDSFTNQTVRILGRVVSLRGDTATLDANGSVTIHLNRVGLP